VVGAHHERADGSGYYRGLTADQQAPVGALLAAADLVQALQEPRPHRQPLDQRKQIQVLRAEVECGRIARWAADAVGGPHWRSAGPPAADSPRRPAAALTDRERQVLALVARGATNRRIAEELRISPKTVNAHLEHIFTKLGVTTRGAAAFHAVTQGWLAP
jgi:DNA-binding CsgD family transcriptional regulator